MRFSMRIINMLLFIGSLGVFHETFPARALRAEEKDQATQLLEHDLIPLKIEVLIDNFLENIQNGNYEIDIRYEFPALNISVGPLDSMKYFLATLAIAGSIPIVLKRITHQDVGIGPSAIFTIAMIAVFVKHQKKQRDFIAEYQTYISQIPPNYIKYLVTKYAIYASAKQFHKQLDDDTFITFIRALNDFEYQRATNIIKEYVRQMSGDQQINAMHYTLARFREKKEIPIKAIIGQITTPYLSVFDFLKQNIITYFRLNEIDKAIYLIYESITYSKKEHDLLKLITVFLNEFDKINLHYTIPPELAERESELNKTKIQTLATINQKRTLEVGKEEGEKSNLGKIDGLLNIARTLHHTATTAYQNDLILIPAYILLSPEAITAISYTFRGDHSSEIPLADLYKNFFNTEMQKKLFDLLLNYNDQKFLEVFDNAPIKHYRELTSRPEVMQSSRLKRFAAGTVVRPEKK